MTAEAQLGLSKGLKCRGCGREYPLVRMAACEFCFAPLEVIYDLDSVGLSRASFKERPRNIWRYRELLPINDERNIIDLNTGYTPLVRAVNLGRALGLREVYMKNDSVNPTFSFKDRPAEVAVSKAIEFGDKAVGCASTGNLAGAVAAHAARAGLPCYVLVPSDLESSKMSQMTAYGARIIAVKGNYDDANRLAVLASEEFGWNIVNVTSRAYYVEGSKTIAYEVAEQLGWRAPDHLIIPIGSGALFCAMDRGFRQFESLGLIDSYHTKMTGAQAAGCAPVADAFRQGLKDVPPVERPDTIAKSIAIGDPGDGEYVLRISRSTGGIVGAATDQEILDAIRLLARTEGIFTEPAGGVTVALLRKMVEDGTIERDESVVCCITGNGLKLGEGLITAGQTERLAIEPSLDSLLEGVERRWPA